MRLNLTDDAIKFTDLLPQDNPVPILAAPPFAMFFGAMLFDPHFWDGLLAAAQAPEPEPVTMADWVQEHVFQMLPMFLDIALEAIITGAAPHVEP